MTASDPPGARPDALAPTLAADRFPLLGERLVDLLRGLSAADWHRATICPGWQVRDIAAHLLDTACRRLAAVRKEPGTVPAGVGPEPPTEALDSDAALVRYLDRLNATWVQTLRRVPPEMLPGWIAAVEPPLAAALAALEPFEPASFAVSWAGEDRSPNWFDVARELTERWHHQQQIRLAVGAAALDDPWLSRPVFEAFLRALPHRYADVAAPPGTAVGIEVTGRAAYRFRLIRDTGGWYLAGGDPAAGGPAAVAAHIGLDEETAWRLLTKGLDPATARRRAALEGSSHLVDPFFATRAIVG